MRTLENKIKSQTTEMLIEVVKGLNNTFGDAEDLVFEIALNELESRMEENKFCELCDEL